MNITLSKVNRIASCINRSKDLNFGEKNDTNEKMFEARRVAD